MGHGGLPFSSESPKSSTELPLQDHGGIFSGVTVHLSYGQYVVLAMYLATVGKYKV